MDEVAEILGISRARAYVMAAEGELPSVRLGRSRRVPVRELDAWIEERVLNARPILRGGSSALSAGVDRRDVIDVEPQEREES